MTITVVGADANPADNGALDTSAPRSPVLVPGIVGRDLVVMVSVARTSAIPTITDTGGQNWHEGPFQFTGSTGIRAWWAEFTGAWIGTPIVSYSFPSTAPCILWLGALHDNTPNPVWNQFLSDTALFFPPPPSPFDVTIQEIPITVPNTVGLFFYSAQDDIAWTLQSGSFSNLGLAQYRNNAGGDISFSAAYKITGAPVNTGPCTNRMASALSGWTLCMAFQAASDFARHVKQVSGLTVKTPILSGSGVIATPDLTAPSVPSGVVANAVSNSQIDISWNASSDAQSGIQFYEILKDNTLTINVGLNLFYSDTGLAAGSLHTYKVRAKDNANNFSAYSTQASATTDNSVAIPVATLQAAGYVVPTASPYNCDPTGVVDCTTAMQQAIDDAFSARKTVWLPSGTYRISNTLRCYRFIRATNASPFSSHMIRGATIPSRPLIKIAPTAPAFDNLSLPRPMIAYLQWLSDDPAGTFEPPDQTYNPYSGPGTQAGDTWSQNQGQYFNGMLINVNFDTSSHPAADGVCFSHAQTGWMANIKVTATNSRMAFNQFSSQGAISCNLEAVGGQYAFSLTDNEFPGIGSGPGPVLAGIKASGQTLGIFKSGSSYMSPTVVGFDFAPAGGAPVLVITTVGSATGFHTMTMLDGRITSSALLFDNTVLKGLYLRNIYVSGTNDLIKSGVNTITAAGTWKKINEYCCNDLRGADIPPDSGFTGSGVLQHFSMIEGTVAHVQEPINSITPNFAAGSVPTDLITKHIATFTSIEDGPYVDAVLDHGASTSGGDARAAIQAAIDAAQTAGHNRVFLRKGDFLIGGTVVLKRDTKLFGIGTVDHTKIAVHPSWAPTTGEPYMFDTEDHTEGTAYLADMEIQRRCLPTPSVNRFSLIKWRVGRKSVMANIMNSREFVTPSSLCTNRRILYDFVGSAGGKIYSTFGDGRAFHGLDVRVVRIVGTTQPLSFYGVMHEIAKLEPSGQDPLTNCEVTNASNIRFYGGKREGGAPSLVLTDSNNVAWYGAGAMLTPVNYFQVYGASSGILIASAFVQGFSQGVATPFMMQENVTGGGGLKTIRWPYGISIYKRGTVNDALINHG